MFQAAAEQVIEAGSPPFKPSPAVSHMQIILRDSVSAATLANYTVSPPPPSPEDQQYQAIPIMTQCHTIPCQTVFKGEKKERGARENEPLSPLSRRNLLLYLSLSLSAVTSAVSPSVLLRLLLFLFFYLPLSLTLFTCHINMHPGWVDF